MSEPQLYNEHELLAKISVGDKAAFAEIFRFYQKEVYSFAYGLTHTDVLAEEITQDVFIKVWEKRGQLPDIQHFRGWIKTVAKNAVYSFYRKAGVEKLALDGFKVHSNGADEYAVDRIAIASELEENKQHFQALLRELPPQQLEIFILSRVHKKSYAEIGALLNITPHTVKYHMTSILRLLRTKADLFWVLSLFLL